MFKHRNRRRKATTRGHRLSVERLEGRRLLAADFGLSSGTLTLDNFTEVITESLAVSEYENAYRFALSEGTWTTQGSPPSGISLASGGQVLVIEKSLLTGDTISEILVSDTASIDFDVTFNDVDLQPLSGSLTLLDVGHVGQLAGSFVQFGHFDVTAASVTLAEAGNDFGSIRATATAGGVTLFDAGDILLGTPGLAAKSSVTGGDYVVTALGTITVSAGHSIDSSGTSSVNLTGARNIALASGSSITTVDGGITLLANQQTTPASGNFVGIAVLGATITSSGAGEIKLHGNGGDESSGNHGVQLRSGAVITGGVTGKVEVLGSGGASSGNSNFGVGVTDSGSQITSKGATVLVEGTGGGAGSSYSNFGVWVSSSGTITSAGMGASVTVKGSGGGGLGSDNFGLSQNHGVYVNSSGVITSAGTDASVTVKGSGGSTAGHANYGVEMVGAGSQITSSGGAVLVEGIGGGTGSSNSNHGVNILSGGTITNAGMGNTATVTVKGLGGNTVDNGSGSNYGVHVNSSSSQITSSGGAVVVEGTGGGGGDSSNNYGVYIVSAGSITSAGTDTTSTVNVTGIGGNSSGTGGNNNYGVYLNSPGSLITSNGGAVLVEGTGGGSVASSNNHGVLVRSSASITSTGTQSTATVTVEGQGGNTAGLGGGSNYGVHVTNALITSSGGAVLVEGKGGGVSTGSLSSLNVGVGLGNAGTITNAGTASTSTVTVRGLGGNTLGIGGNGNYGVYVDGTNSVNGNSAVITSNGGAVLVEGSGGGIGDSNVNHGVVVQFSGSITSEGTDGTATVMVKGVGGNTSGIGNLSNYGISVRGTNAIISSSGGEVVLDGTEGGGLYARGLRIENDGKIAGSVSTPAVTLIGDSIDLNSAEAVDVGSNQVVILPRTAGTQIDLGGDAVIAGNPSTLGLTNAEIARITAGSLVFGNTHSGTLTVSANIARMTSTDMQLISGGDIVISGGSIDTGGGTLSLHAGDSPAAIKPTRNGTDAVASSIALADDLVIVIDGAAVNTDYTQLSVVGKLDLTGVELVLSGTYVSMEGDVLTIVSATSVTGQFNGLEHGDQVIFNGKSLTIQYGSTVVTLVANINSAPSVEAGGPYIIKVGEDLTLVASESSDADGDPLTFTWDLTGNAEFVDAIGTSPTLNWESLVVLGINGPGDYHVAVQISDGVYSDIATTTITVLYATPTITIDWTGGTYSGSEFSATGVVLGFDDSEIGTPTFTYFLGLDTTGTPLAAAPVDAGTYTVQADFAGDALHFAASATATVVINKANASIVVNSTTVTYDGNSRGASGTAIGVNGEILAGLDLGDSFTNVPGGTANWGFTDVTGNYHNASGSVDIVINQRKITVSASNQTKVYGDADPVLTYEITDGSLVATDNFFGELAREPGEDVGSYAIKQGSLGLSDNYDLSFVEAELTITHAILTGDATTQDALNTAKQGTLNITVSKITGFVNAENAAVFLRSASFWITIDDERYEFVTTSVTLLSDSSISISYTLKNSELQASLATALESATSGSTAIEAGFLMESINYRLSDDYLSRLFSTMKK